LVSGAAKQVTLAGNGTIMNRAQRAVHGLDERRTKII
jgi:ribosomal protein L35